MLFILLISGVSCGVRTSPKSSEIESPPITPFRGKVQAPENEQEKPGENYESKS